jgi:4-hydroxybenzoate polyprenyltransferase
LLAAAAIALYHMKLIRHREPQQCFRAFLHNAWFGAAVFGGIVLNYLLPVL